MGLVEKRLRGRGIERKNGATGACGKLNLNPKSTIQGPRVLQRQGAEQVDNPDEEWNRVLQCRAQSSQVKVLHKCRTCCIFKHDVQLANEAEET